jgi:hypothetical protein
MEIAGDILRRGLSFRGHGKVLTARGGHCKHGRMI